MTKKEVTDQKVIKALDNLEWQTLLETGYTKLSGSFCKTDVVDYDDDYFTIILTYGVNEERDGGANTEETLYMDRVTLEVND
jgi:hypothetical protein